MKKKILTVAIALFAALSVNAQSDGFFSSNSGYRNAEDPMGDMPAIIGHGYTTDQKAPIGSGLLILAGLGLAYGMKKIEN